MINPLKLGELRKVIHSYVAFDALCSESKELVTDAIELIFISFGAIPFPLGEGWQPLLQRSKMMIDNFCFSDKLLFI